ncbi:Na+/H+ antiporter NhaC family protein [Desulfitobacterium sp.]|uniref:Na+/H+ antiporter NhaC family protein n=1 Tax=Desulfitobacterium sp. TaxID=49981 RepID=UPI002B20DC9E|nr:Na+/H+ antiporter NhaC family protein [Desulfitobacterium sp.]MEA4900682.1 Na+/H+ antiporter NhaC family protein [Desulfitobacterium sp.]
MATEPKVITKSYALIATVPAILALIAASQVGLPLQIPFIFGIFLSGFIGVRLGYHWTDIEGAALDGMGQCSFAVLIILLIGATIGIWMAAGIIPSFIFYGLQWLSPPFFLTESFILTFIMALVTGSDAAAFGTIGVALLGLGTALGLPMPIIVGAITSGGLAGHLVSPLSDLSALAISQNGGQLPTLIRLLLRRGLPVFLISAVLYLLYGMVGLKNTTLPDVSYLRDGLLSLFQISPWLFLPVVVLFLLILFRVPIIPALGVNLLFSSAIAMKVQGLSLMSVIQAMSFGYTLNQNSLLGQILTRGGVINFGNVVELMLLASAWALTMERIGVIKLILNSLMNRKIFHGKINALATLLGTLISAMTCAIIPAILVPSPFLMEKYRLAGWQSEHLSKDLIEGSFAIAALVPWSNMNFLVLGTLGIGAFQTAPYNFFPIILLSVAFISGFFGKKSVDETE